MHDGRASVKKRRGKKRDPQLDGVHPIHYNVGIMIRDDHHMIMISLY